jgi:ribonuclease-3
MASNNAATSAEGRAIQDLSERLGHDFDKPELLRRGLTHPSAASRRADNYERLEFLGDRVLGLIIADLLLQRFPAEAEGQLARRHAAVVRREALAEVAINLKLGEAIFLAKGEDDAGERENPAILADSCEAVIAALYLDGGLEAARSLVVKYWSPLIEADRKRPPRDAKTSLQEWAQGRGLPLPNYRETHREGPAHGPRFTVEVTVQGLPAAQGSGRSKRLAEQDAASRLLARLSEGCG